MWHQSETDKDGVAAPTISQRKFRPSWAILIQLVWEVNPLECRKSGSLMKIIAIIEDKGLVEATLCSLGLWKELAPRGPPLVAWASS